MECNRGVIARAGCRDYTERMPKTTELSGVMVPVVTTFDARGESLDVAAFTSNIQAYVEAGIAGIVVAGSSGEAPFLTDAERGVLIEAARGVVPADRWLIAGAGAESTRQTVERAREAARRGADAVLVVAPHYFPQSTTALNESTPELTIARPYAVDLTGWFEGYSHPGGTDAVGTYNRVEIDVNAFSDQTGTLTLLLPLRSDSARQVI